MISVELCDVFERAESINVYKDGEIKIYSSNDEVFEKILLIWNGITKDAYEMPAYGVSLNRETVNAIKSGLWTEFVFNDVYESNGMPYEKLLINVNKDFYGFNLIRYTSETGYDGRCFYYDLNGGNMNALYDFLNEI